MLSFSLLFKCFGVQVYLELLPLPMMSVKLNLVRTDDNFNATVTKKNSSTFEV